MTVAPFDVRGVTYYDVQSCAAHLGVHEATVRLAIKFGKLDRLGMRNEQTYKKVVKETTAPKPTRKPKDLEIRGVWYKSVASAALRLGVSMQTIYVARAAGKLDSVGLGSGHHNKRKTRWRGKWYSSTAEAAAAAGVTPQHFVRCRKRRKLNKIGSKPRRRTLADGPFPSMNGIPTTICGLEFKSMSQVDKFIGKRRGYTHRVLTEGGEVAKQHLEYAVNKQIKKRNITVTQGLTQ